MVFEDVRELMQLREVPMLAVFEVCVPTNQPYQYKETVLDPRYATSCTCKRAGFPAYHTACFRDSGYGVVDPMLDASNSPLIQSSAMNNPSVVDE
jgi:hypothetical protein